MRRAVLAPLLCAALLSAGAWGQALDVREPATVRALPGAYATLAFGLTGDGTYDYVVATPAPWQPLASAGSVRVDGHGFVSATLRVPRSVPAGAVVEVEIRFTARDAADAAPVRAAGRVEVLPLGAIELIAPPTLEGGTDEALRFAVIVQLPSRLDLALQGESWTASGSFADGRTGLAGSADAGDWRVGGSASWTALDDVVGYGVSAFAGSLQPELDLQLNARVAGARDERTDVLSARYRRPLGEDLDLRVGADLVASAGATGYLVQPVLSEGLTGRVGAFDFAQSYSGVPFAGLHTVGLSGGTRVAGVGVRASTSAQIAGDDPR